MGRKIDGAEVATDPCQKLLPLSFAEADVPTVIGDIECRKDALASLFSLKDEL